MDTMDIVLYLLNERHLRQSELCSYLGISQQKFTDWKSGRVRSYNKYLDKIASFFNVSTDYLLGVNDLANRKISPVAESFGAEEDIKKALLNALVRAGLLSPDEEISADKQKIINDCLDIIVLTLKD